MTPQDTQMLQDFLAALTRAQVGTKDRDAQTLIARAFAQQPDAAYLVVQRALLLEQALKQAQAQIAQLQQQSSSFLGTQPWNAQPAPNRSAAAAPADTPAAPGPRSAEAGSPWGSFLGNAAATAAGVAGGAFLFHGLENLAGHGGGFSAANAPAETVENVTVNNYGGDHDSADLAASDTADDAFDPVDAGDSSDDASWT
jgi:hypothetical protein